MGLVLHVLLTW